MIKVRYGLLNMLIVHSQSFSVNCLFTGAQIMFDSILTDIETFISPDKTKKNLQTIAKAIAEEIKKIDVRKCARKDFQAFEERIKIIIKSEEEEIEAEQKKLSTDEKKSSSDIQMGKMLLETRKKSIQTRKTLLTEAVKRAYNQSHSLTIADMMYDSQFVDPIIELLIPTDKNKPGYLTNSDINETEFKKANEIVNRIDKARKNISTPTVLVSKLGEVIQKVKRSADPEKLNKLLMLKQLILEKYSDKETVYANWKDAILSVLYLEDNRVDFLEISGQLYPEQALNPDSRFKVIPSGYTQGSSITSGSTYVSTSAKKGETTNIHVLDAAYTVKTQDGLVILIGDGLGGHHDDRQDKDISRAARFALKSAARQFLRFKNAEDLVKELKRDKISFCREISHLVNSKLIPTYKSGTTLSGGRVFLDPNDDNQARFIGIGVGDTLIFYYDPKTQKFKNIVPARELVQGTGGGPATITNRNFNGEDILVFDHELPKDAKIFGISDGVYWALPTTVEKTNVPSSEDFYKDTKLDCKNLSSGIEVLQKDTAADIAKKMHHYALGVIEERRKAKFSNIGAKQKQVSELKKEFQVQKDAFDQSYPPTSGKPLDETGKKKKDQLEHLSRQIAEKEKDSRLQGGDDYTISATELPKVWKSSATDLPKDSGHNIKSTINFYNTEKNKGKCLLFKHPDGILKNRGNNKNRFIQLQHGWKKNSQLSFSIRVSCVKQIDTKLEAFSQVFDRQYSNQALANHYRKLLKFLVHWVEKNPNDFIKRKEAIVELASNILSEYGLFASNDAWIDKLLIRANKLNNFLARIKSGAHLVAIDVFSIKGPKGIEGNKSSVQTATKVNAIATVLLGLVYQTAKLDQSKQGHQKICILEKGPKTERDEQKKEKGTGYEVEASSFFNNYLSSFKNELQLNEPKFVNEAQPEKSFGI